MSTPVMKYLNKQLMDRYAKWTAIEDMTEEDVETHDLKNQHIPRKKKSKHR